MPPELVPVAAVRAARAELDRLAATSVHRTLFATLARRAVEEDVLDPEQVLAGPPRLLSGRDVLARALGDGADRTVDVPAGAVTLRVASPVDELWQVAQALDADGVVALDALLRRATDPVEALATWPLEALFTAAEAERLRSRAGEPVVPATAGPRFVCAIVKFTRLCNLRCTYCHDWRAGPGQTMPFEVQRALFSRLLREPEHGRVDVVWHGGEPTLIGPRGFLRVLAMQRALAGGPGAPVVRNLVQTNATRLDPAWARRLSRYRMDVGISIDGPRELHDRTRVFVDGTGSWAAVRRGMDALHAEGITANVHVVVGPEQVRMGAAELVGTLAADGVRRLSLLPVRPGAGQTGAAYLSRDEHARFLVDVDDALRAMADPPVVRELAAARLAVAGAPPGFCELVGDCVGSFYTVESDGTVAHCDKYVGDPDYDVGNVLVDDFRSIRAGDAGGRIAAAADRRHADWGNCPRYRYCRGWCPHEHYTAREHDPDGAGSCCGLSPLFEHLEADRQAADRLARR